MQPAVISQFVGEVWRHNGTSVQTLKTHPPDFPKIIAPELIVGMKFAAHLPKAIR